MRNQGLIKAEQALKLSVKNKNYWLISELKDVAKKVKEYSSRGFTNCIVSVSKNNEFKIIQVLRAQGYTISQEFSGKYSKDLLKISWGDLNA